MIDAFVQRFDEKRDDIKQMIRDGVRDPDYETLFGYVVTALSNPEDYMGTPDPERIHRVDDGHYQGTLVFVVAETGYQPSQYWATKVNYGSCSGCDTLQRILGWSEEALTDTQVEDLFTLCLHMLQNMVEV